MLIPKEENSTNDFFEDHRDFIFPVLHLLILGI